MTGFTGNIEDLTINNNAFRRVIHTARHMQLVVMSLQIGEDIGEEKHDNVDQFFRVENGTASIWIDGDESTLTDGMVAIVPAGSVHNLKNIGKGILKLYTIYSPANHPGGTVHPSKADALLDERH